MFYNVCFYWVELFFIFEMYLFLIVWWNVFILKLFLKCFYLFKYVFLFIYLF